MSKPIKVTFGIFVPIHHFRHFTFLSWESRARLWTKTFAMMPFDGKYQNLYVEIHISSLAITVSRDSNISNLLPSKGRSSQLQLSQWYHAMANIKICKYFFYFCQDMTWAMKETHRHVRQRNNQAKDYRQNLANFLKICKTDFLKIIWRPIMKLCDFS